MKQTKVPRLMSNPITVLEMANEMREHADNVEKFAADNGRVTRERPRVVKIRAFAKQLEDLGNGKLGDQENQFSG
jgi:hypothetical protein